MIADEPHPVTLHNRDQVFDGRVWDVRRDDLSLDTHRFTRDYVLHPGAVGVIAVDHELNLLLVAQYRHPHGAVMWEAPAGLLDAPDEDPLAAAKRELLEETGYEASTWNVLLDLSTSPGGSSEQIRLYLAQGLTAHPSGRPASTDEEAHLVVEWHSVAEVLAAIQAGDVTNAALVAGTLALLTAMAEPAALRPADSAWRSREALLDADRVRLPLT